MLSVALPGAALSRRIRTEPESYGKHWLDAKDFLRLRRETLRS